MAYRDSPFQELKVPLTWTAGLAAVLALALAVFVFVSDRKDQARVTAEALGHAKARAGFDSVLAPVSGVLAAPVRWINDGTSSIGDYFFAVSENRRLKRQLAELQQVAISDVALKNLNRRYEELLKLRTEPPIPMVTGRVVSDTRGPFSNARLIDVGSDQGIKIGNPAMSDQGVVGRVVGVSPNASRILLLTDPESRTPVLIDRSNARAVLTGDGGPNPRLEYLRGKDAVHNGDRVLTSGDGGLYPRGLPVGVAEQDIRGVWRVRLYSDSGAIDFVRVLVFDDFSQMVDQAKLAEPVMPPLSAADEAKVKAAEAPPPAAPAAASAPGSATRTGAATPVPRQAPTPSRTEARPPAVSTTPPAALGDGNPSVARKPEKRPLPTKHPAGEYRRVHTPDETQDEPNRLNGPG